MDQARFFFSRTQRIEKGKKQLQVISHEVLISFDEIGASEKNEWRESVNLCSEWRHKHIPLSCCDTFLSHCCLCCTLI